MHSLSKLVASLLVTIPLVSCSGLDGSSSRDNNSIVACEHECDEEPAPCDTDDCGEPPPPTDDGCTLTQGYWKNHEEAWPVDSLMLGNHSYVKADLLDILRTPVRGNGLVSLAHQLIAAKLNVASGASTTGAIADADALIGNLVVGSDHLSPSSTSGLVGELDAYNNGNAGPEHCDGGPGDGGGCGDGGGDCPTPPICGNGALEDGEACDDGNTASGDGCSEACTVEAGPVCVCGDGIVHDGIEECDDGNTTSGDGCSATCTTEQPVCGNDIVEPGEQCDDGNTNDHDGCSPTCVIETNPCNPC